MPPAVSVVVATYNRAPLLARALESVSAQTMNDWECLVCDDGSSDGSADLVLARAAVDPRFRLISGPRAGLPAAPRNRGLAAAEGRWVAFLDDDDLWHPRKLERQLALAEATGSEAVSARAVPCGADAPDFDHAIEDGARVSLGLTDVLTSGPNHPTTSATMVRRGRLLDVSGFPESPAYRAVEDFDLWCRLLAVPGVRWVADTGAPLAAHRENGPDSISAWDRVLDPDVIRQRWAVIECITRVLAATPPAVTVDRPAVLRDIQRQAVECAGRCRAVGWKAVAAAAYAVAALAAVAARDASGVAQQSYRMGRARVVNASRTPAPMPEHVPPLVRRARSSAWRLAGGRPASMIPLSV